MTISLLNESLSLSLENNLYDVELNQNKIYRNVIINFIANEILLISFQARRVYFKDLNLEQNRIELLDFDSEISIRLVH